MSLCTHCIGRGEVEVMEFEYITEDMATDSGEPEMAGQQVEVPSVGQCPMCMGEGRDLAVSLKANDLLEAVILSITGGISLEMLTDPKGIDAKIKDLREYIADLESSMIKLPTDAITRRGGK